MTGVSDFEPKMMATFTSLMYHTERAGYKGCHIALRPPVLSGKLVQEVYHAVNCIGL